MKSERSNPVSIAKFRGKVDETGQSVSINVPRRRKRQRGWREKVAMLDLDNITRLELSGLEYRILFAVMAAVPEKGGCRAVVTFDEIARTIDSSVPSVSRAMGVLRDRRIITREGNRVGRLVVNPWLMFNGDFDSWSAETDDSLEPIWTRGVNITTGEL